MCDELFCSNRARERDDNLLFVRERLLRAETDLASLLDLYVKIHSGECVADDETSALITVLRLSGIVKAERGRLRERNRIYYRVFDRDWVRANMPDAEVRRQKAAFRRGAIRASVIATGVAAALGLMAVIAMRQTLLAHRALALANFSYVSQAQASLVSALSGQRFQSLEAIRKASDFYTNRTDLRNLAISALSLFDLKKQPPWPGYPPGTVAAALHPSFQLCARANQEGSIEVQKITGGDRVAHLSSVNRPIDQMRFSPDGHYLAITTSGSNSEMVVWDWRNATTLLRVPHHNGRPPFDFDSETQQLAIEQLTKFAA